MDELTLFKMTEKAFNFSPIQKNELYNNIKIIIDSENDPVESSKKIVLLFEGLLKERKILMAETQSNPSILVEPPKGGAFRRVM